MEKQKQNVFDKLETFYLSAMRKALLVFATILFAYAAIVGISSLYKMTRSADDVVEAKPDIKTADIIPTQSSISNSTQDNRSNPSVGKSSIEPKTPFSEHTLRMYAIWTSKFEVHHKAGDPKLSESEFTNWYKIAFNKFITSEWCAVQEVCTEDDDKEVGFYLIPSETTISAAADDPGLRARMAAASSGESDGYDNVFVNVNRNFWVKLTEQRRINQEAAVDERLEINAGKIAGGLMLVSAGWAFAAFISLIFAFLIVAIERHQRKMAADIERIKANFEVG